MLATKSISSSFIKGATVSARNAGSVKSNAFQGSWRPGADLPKHLESSNLPGNFGFDPLGLGANDERLKYFAEAERVHARWAMLGVAGILAGELTHPDVFWYTAPTKIDLPFNLAGLAAFQLFTMHWVESKRGWDLKNPGSQDQDPVFSGNKLRAHDVGYPGTVFDPMNMDSPEMRLKEIKNGRLAMLAFIGMVMAAQVTGLNPLAALGAHVADPLNTSIFGKAAVIPGQSFAPPCAIPDTVTVQGVTLPAGCFLKGLWP